MYKSFITLLTHTSIGKISNLFNVENNKIQSATFGPTPDKFNSSALADVVSNRCNFDKSISLFKTICVVSNNLISLKPNPSFLKSSTVTSFN